MPVVLLSQEKSNLPPMKNTSFDMPDTTWPTTKPVTIGNSHTDGTEDTDTPKGTPVPSLLAQCCQSLLPLATIGYSPPMAPGSRCTVT